MEGSNNYSIYTLVCQGIQILDLSSMSKQLFNYQVVPRLGKQPDLTIDYNDESTLRRSIDNLIMLKKIVSSINKANQA